MTIRGIATFLLLAGCAVRAHPETSAAAGDEAAAALRGRTAGTELSCVSTHELRGSRALRASQAILFEGHGDLLYLNRPRGGCPGLAEDLALLTSTPAGQLCAGDIVQAFDAASGTAHASCTLGSFVPYPRAR